MKTHDNMYFPLTHYLDLNQQILMRINTNYKKIISLEMIQLALQLDKYFRVSEWFW